MTEPPKSKRSSDRTSTVVVGTMILLTVLGVVTVFWEPLAAIASGGSTGEASEPRALIPDGGVAPTSSPSRGAARDASGNS
jgi:hypothetical protein